MKWVFLIFGIASAILTWVFKSDIVAILSAIFISTFSIMDQIDKKFKNKVDEQLL
jgi:hypothetical protein